MKFTVSEIAQMLDGIIVGDDKITIDSAAKIEEGQPGCISFLANSKYEPYIYTTQSSAVIVNKDFSPKKEINATLIYVENAYTAFTILLEEYQKRISKGKFGVEEPNFFGENSQMGTGGYRGAFSYIGKNCLIGDGVKIYPHSYLGDNVTVGDNSTIHPGVRIYDNTIIGKNCCIFANTVIGSDGFGFAPQTDGIDTTNFEKNNQNVNESTTGKVLIADISIPEEKTGEYPALRQIFDQARKERQARKMRIQFNREIKKPGLWSFVHHSFVQYPSVCPSIILQKKAEDIPH